MRATVLLFLFLFVMSIAIAQPVSTQPANDDEQINLDDSAVRNAFFTEDSTRMNDYPDAAHDFMLENYGVDMSLEGQIESFDGNTLVTSGRHTTTITSFESLKGKKLTILSSGKVLIEDKAVVSGTISYDEGGYNIDEGTINGQDVFDASQIVFDKAGNIKSGQAKEFAGLVGDFTFSYDKTGCIGNCKTEIHVLAGHIDGAYGNKPVGVSGTAEFSKDIKNIYVPRGKSLDMYVQRYRFKISGDDDVYIGNDFKFSESGFFIGKHVRCDLDRYDITLPDRGYFTKDDFGIDVQNVQKMLNYELAGVKGFSGVELTGKYDLKTISAVKMWQRFAGEKNDGFFGKSSLKKLRSHFIAYDGTMDVDLSKSRIDIDITGNTRFQLGDSYLFSKDDQVYGSLGKRNLMDVTFSTPLNTVIFDGPERDRSTFRNKMYVMDDAPNIETVNFLAGNDRHVMLSVLSYEENIGKSRLYEFKFDDGKLKMVCDKCPSIDTFYSNQKYKPMLFLPSEFVKTDYGYEIRLRDDIPPSLEPLIRYSSLSGARGAKAWDRALSEPKKLMALEDIAAHSQFSSDILVAIAIQESGFDETKVRKEADGTKSIGLFQINQKNTKETIRTDFNWQAKQALSTLENSYDAFDKYAKKRGIYADEKTKKLMSVVMYKNGPTRIKRYLDKYNKKTMNIRDLYRFVSQKGISNSIQYIRNIEPFL